MVDSGIKPTAEGLAAFNDGYKTKTKLKYDYLIYNIGKVEGSKHKTVNLIESPELGYCKTEYENDVKDGESPLWHGFVKALTKEAGQPKFGVCYFEYLLGTSTTQNSKLKFIWWSPEDCKAGDNMIYSSTKLSFEKKLGQGRFEKYDQVEEFSYAEIRKTI